MGKYIYKRREFEYWNKTLEGVQFYSYIYKNAPLYLWLLEYTKILKCLFFIISVLVFTTIYIK